MKKIYNKIIILIFFLVTSCSGGWESVKQGLGGQKRTSTDEFLVKKKYPLTLPPQFDSLPEPGRSVNLSGSDDIAEVTDIEQLLQEGRAESSSSNIEQSSGGSLEETLLKKIKQQ